MPRAHHLLRFERKTHRPLPLHLFVNRLFLYILASLTFTGLSLVVGIIGYRYFEDLAWVDCFVNAAMILGGMGEIDPLKTDGGKIFAGIYALYSGLWVVACAGLIIAPVFHRILHKFHADDK